MPSSFSGIGGWKIQDSELRDVSAHFVQDNSGAYVLGTIEGTTNTAEGGQTFIAGIFNSAAQATIFGLFNSANNNGAIFGTQNIATGGMVQGTNNTADDSFVFGYQNSGKKCSFIQGDHNTAFDYSTCYGYNNTANNSAFTHGYANEASGYSFAAGRNISSVNTSLAHGFYSKANNMSLSQGHSNTAIEDSFAQGQQNFASGNSFAQGFKNYSEDHSMTQGRFNSAYYYSQAFGNSNIISGNSTNYGGMAIGHFNKTSSDVAFVIGNGDSNNRSDAFVVDCDGNTSAAGTLAISGINDVGAEINNKLNSADAFTQSSADTLYYPLSNNPSGYLTEITGDFSGNNVSATSVNLKYIFDDGGNYYTSSVVLNAGDLFFQKTNPGTSEGTTNISADNIHLAGGGSTDASMTMKHDKIYIKTQGIQQYVIITPTYVEAKSANNVVSASWYDIISYITAHM